MNNLQKHQKHSSENLNQSITATLNSKSKTKNLGHTKTNNRSKTSGIQKKPQIHNIRDTKLNDLEPINLRESTTKTKNDPYEQRTNRFFSFSRRKRDLSPSFTAWLNPDQNLSSSLSKSSHGRSEESNENKSSDEIFFFSLSFRSFLLLLSLFPFFGFRQLKGIIVFLSAVILD